MTIQRSLLQLTLYWHDNGIAASEDVGLPDVPPERLIGMLVHQCKLRTQDYSNMRIEYELRLGAEDGQVLRNDQTLSEQGVAKGSRLWLVPRQQRVRPSRCILTLPDETEIILSRQRPQQISRGWLLKLLEIYNADAHNNENNSSESRYKAVSRDTHCTIQYNSRNRRWELLHNHDTSETLHNGVALRERNPRRLADGDTLQLGGSGGLYIQISII